MRPGSTTIETARARITEIGSLPWRAVLRRFRANASQGYLSLAAAGVAFFGFLAIFPAVAALAAIYGVAFDRGDVAQQMLRLRSLLPPEALSLLTHQAERLSTGATTSLSVGAVVAFGVALWSATKGARGIIQATNLAYGEAEHRGFVRLNVVALGLTAAAFGFIITLLVLAAGVPVALSWVGLDGEIGLLINLGRWPLIAALVMFASATVYYVAPSRDRSKWRLVTPGSVLATLLLLVASGSFSAYVENFANYNQTYGSVGAVAVFLVWLYIAGYVVLLGAELDAAVELARSVDTVDPELSPDGAWHSAST